MPATEEPARVETSVLAGGAFVTFLSCHVQEQTERSECTPLQSMSHSQKLSSQQGFHVEACRCLAGQVRLDYYCDLDHARVMDDLRLQEVRVGVLSRDAA